MNKINYDHYDHIIVGKNYITLACGLSLLRQGKKVLIINDDRLGLGESWYNEIGLLEKEYLNLFLEYKCHLGQNLMDKYTDQRVIILMLDEIMVQLGESPYTNLKELARKVPYCFNTSFIKKINKIKSEDFDKNCIDLTKKIVQTTFEKYKFDDFQKSVFDMDLRGDLKKVYDLFQESLLNESYEEGHRLYFSLQVAFQSVFSNLKKPLEIHYLLTSLLNPRFNVDSKALLDDLCSSFFDNGGNIKNTQISEWQIHENSLKGVVLESYEGFIMSDSLALFSEPQWFMPFKEKDYAGHYKVLKLKTLISHKFLHFYFGKRIILTSDEKIGTDFPHIILDFDSVDGFTSDFYYLEFPGSKSSFNTKEAFGHIFDALSKILPNLNFDQFRLNTTVFEDSHVLKEVQVTDINSTYLNNKYIQDRAVLYDEKSMQPIKNLNFWGNLRVGQMGLFSYLIDMKDHF
jgi:hypothetical protein